MRCIVYFSVLQPSVVEKTAGTNDVFLFKILLVGISLQLEQWEKLKNLVGDIDEAIEELRG